MPPTLSPQEFVARWRSVAGNEQQHAQSHFIDLCRLVGQPTPQEADPGGTRYTFERAVTKTGGGHGRADVWKRGAFALEYKKPGSDLDRAYQQLLQYRESLENPPLLIVSDLRTIRAHTNITNSVPKVYTWTLDDLLIPARLDELRRVWTDPFSLRAETTPAQVTEHAAREFAKLAELLRKWGEPSDRAAHFLIRLLFCLFAEDVGLLPERLFTRLVNATWMRPRDFASQLRMLFGAMRDGGMFGFESIAHFNGGLFDTDEVIELDSEGMAILARLTDLDWSGIEPAILGTLFERSLDPAKRSQLGAHYTSRDDILLIVEPVLMSPLRRRWDAVRERALELARRRDESSGGQRTRLMGDLERLIRDFDHELASIRVLDPACGSGNFLYVALKQMLDLEKEVRTFAGEVGLTMFAPQVSPEQLHGIEVNEYARELAQVTVWIGYIQWLRDNGFGQPSEPILKPLDTIHHMDAVLAFDSNGRPVEPPWPAADVIIGNPPFLGDKKMRAELGDSYVDSLRALYAGHVPGGADLVTYWFERARKLIEAGQVQRAGLLATNSIRGGPNRRVLERIKASGDLFMAWGDRPWILDGAAVRVSMVGFDGNRDGVDGDGRGTARRAPTERMLDGVRVQAINADLTGAFDLTAARRLRENIGLSFIGGMKKGTFDISDEAAQRMLRAPLNPNGRQNSDVIRPWINGLDITRRPRNMWIIDFGVDASEADAALYEYPYEHVRRYVKPEREKVNNPLERKRWWLHGRSAPDLRDAVSGLRRYIATARVAKHRLFVFVPASTLPDGQIVVIAREDDYFFGVLHSKVHEVWALRMGTSLEDRPRYTPTTTFETFPFPWPPGHESPDDPRVIAIASAARELVEKRDRWLNPPEADESVLKKRTLTNLYNERPTWLDLAHRKLDQAVLDAYGWPRDITDDEILSRLLALNLNRAVTTRDGQEDEVTHTEA